jgi:hypothetical protein
MMMLSKLSEHLESSSTMKNLRVQREKATSRASGSERTDGIDDWFDGRDGCDCWWDDELLLLRLLLLLERLCKIHAGGDADVERTGWALGGRENGEMIDLFDCGMLNMVLMITILMAEMRGRMKMYEGFADDGMVVTTWLTVLG